MYQSAALGFEFNYPAGENQAATAQCQPKESAGTNSVDIGTNITIRVVEASGRTASSAGEAFLANTQARGDKTTNTRLSDRDAVRIDYRLQLSGRYGIATFAVHQGKIYTLIFEMRDLAQCGGFTGPSQYESILSTFRFVP